MSMLERTTPPTDTQTVEKVTIVEVKTTMSIEDQLDIVRKDAHQQFLSGNSRRKQQQQQQQEQEQQQQQQQQRQQQSINQSNLFY